MCMSDYKKHKPEYSIKQHAKKFPDDELDVLNNMSKFNSDGIRYTHLKNNIKKNFVKIKIAEFKKVFWFL